MDVEEAVDSVATENRTLRQRILELENRCARYDVQINQLHQIVASLQVVKAKPAQPAQVQAVKAQAPAPGVRTKPPPPLLVGDSIPVVIGPVDMAGQEAYQRKHGFKAPPPDSLVMPLDLQTFRVKTPPWKEPAPKPPAVPPKPPQQNPPIPPPAQYPPGVKPPPPKRGKAPPVQAGDQQSVIV